MKFILLTLFVCAFASTGFSIPVVQEDLIEDKYALYDALSHGLESEDGFEEVNPDDLSKMKEEEELNCLEKIKKQLEELRKKFEENGKAFKVKVIDVYIEVINVLIQKLKEHNLDNTYLYDFLERVREFLDKHRDFKAFEISGWSKLSSDDLMDLDDLNDLNDSEDNMPIVDAEYLPEIKEADLNSLEKIEKQLKELRKKFEEEGKAFKVKVVDAYIGVIDVLIQKLKQHNLDSTFFYDFMNRVREFLDKQRELTGWSRISFHYSNEMNLPIEEQREEIKVLERFVKELEDLAKKFEEHGKVFMLDFVHGFKERANDLIQKFKTENESFKTNPLIFIQKVRSALQFLEQSYDAFHKKLL